MVTGAKQKQLDNVNNIRLEASRPITNNRNEYLKSKFLDRTTPVLLYCTVLFFIQGPIFSLKGTYVQPKHVVAFTCMAEVIYRF